MAKVVFEHLYKSWGNFTAVRDLNLVIEDREFLVLVGPSGCGKSTILRCLAGLEEITSGRIFIDDAMVNHMAPGDRDIAMVFQSYALYPHKTAYENMAFGLKQRKTPKKEIDRQVREVAESLGITELLNRRPKQMSGGQRQRVALGRAIVRQPKVFLFDEPLSNLDAKLRVQTRAEISQLHQRLGATFIYVTHDQVEAMTMADRICVLKDGVLEQVDTAQNLYHRPANVFVAGFIGSPAMNFFDGQVTLRDGHLAAASNSLSIPLDGEARQGLTEGDAGRKIIFGFRPGDIKHPDFRIGDSPGSTVRAEAEMVEMTGSELFVHFRASGGERFVSRVDTRSAMRVGMAQDMIFENRNIHLFDAETRQRI